MARINTIENYEITLQPVDRETLQELSAVINQILMPGLSIKIGGKAAAAIQDLGLSINNTINSGTFRMPGAVTGQKAWAGAVEPSTTISVGSDGQAPMPPYTSAEGQKATLPRGM